MKTTTILLTLCGVSLSANAQLLYDADFSNEGDGIPDHSSSEAPAAGPLAVDGGSLGIVEGRWTASYQTAPSTDTTANEFSVNSGVLRIQDWGDTDGRWESFSIDVSGVNLVDITAIGVTIGDEVQSSGSEFFDYFYRLDGGADQTTSVVLSGESAGTAVDYGIDSLDVSAASSLTVGFAFQVNGAGDGYELSSFSVNAVPEPATAAVVLGAVAFLMGVVRRRR